MSESRMKKAKRNIMTSLMQNILNLLLTFVSRIIFVRILDASYLGINGLFANVLNILSMADLGIGTAMMYSLYKPIADEDKIKIGALIAFFKKLYLIIAMSILVMGLAVLPFLNYIIRLEAPVPYLEWYYIIALLNVVVSYLFVYRTTLLAADQKSYILNRYIMIFKVITFVVQIVVLVLFNNYFLYLISALGINFISNFCQNQITLKNYPFLREKPCRLEDTEKRRIGRDVKATFLYRLCGTVQNNTDSILISVMVGTVFVGYYSNYLMIISAVISIITLIFTSLKASIGNIIASNDKGQEEKLFLFNVLEMVNFWMIGFCSVCFICLFSDFITIFFGVEYVLHISVVVMATLNFYTNNIRQTIWVFRETTGLFYETRYVTAVTAVLNLGLSLLLGLLFGMEGIIAATVIARMLYAWWKEPLVLFGRFFERSAKTYYRIYIKRVCLCIVVCFVTYSLCNLFFVENIYLHFITNILVCCIVPNAIFLICFYKTPEFHYVGEQIIDPVIGRFLKRYKEFHL